MEENNIRRHKVAHFHQRLLERFGITLTTQEYEELFNHVTDFTKSRPVYLAPNNDISCHRYKIHNCSFVIIFCWIYECPITVYRNSWFRKVSKDTWIPTTKRKTSKKIREKDKRRQHCQKHYNSYIMRVNEFGINENMDT